MAPWRDRGCGILTCQDELGLLGDDPDPIGTIERSRQHRRVAARGATGTVVPPQYSRYAMTPAICTQTLCDDPVLYKYPHTAPLARLPIPGQAPLKTIPPRLLCGASVCRVNPPPTTSAECERGPYSGSPANCGCGSGGETSKEGDRHNGVCFQTGSNPLVI